MFRQFSTCRKERRMSVDFQIKSISLSIALAMFGLAVGAMPNPASAQYGDRCNDFANQGISFDQRARQMRCQGWNGNSNYQRLYDWCQRNSPAQAQRATAKWGTEFQRCQFQASGSPVAQQPRPAAQPAQGLGCPRPGTVRSQNSNQAATIQFVNNSFRPLKIYWLDFQGQRVFYRDLRHGQSYMQPTYFTHPWIAVDPNGSCFTPFRATTAGVNRMEIR